MINDTTTRDMIAAAVASVANEVCQEGYQSLDQEPQLTSKIVQALRSALNNERIGDYEIKVIAQDLPDRGSDSLERRVGADLYFGVRLKRGTAEKTKGFLVQAKWDGDMTSRERKQLDRQCKDMLERTPSSYVWVYSEDGIRVIHARTVANRKKIKVGFGRELQPHLADVFACLEGDISIGLPPGAERSADLNEMLQRLRVPTGMEVSIERPKKDRRVG